MFYGINLSNIKYLCKLIGLHGTEILRSDNNRVYSPEFKIAAINRVLTNYESVLSVALELGLSSSGMLTNWIRNYKNNGYNIIEKKKGRPPMIKNKNDIDNENDLAKTDKIKELERQLEYAKAENEYLKKLNVIVSKRVESEKKKKQK